MAETIEEKLIRLGIPKEEVPVDVEILTASTTLSYLTAEKRSRGWGMAGNDQYLTRFFKPLCRQSPAVLERVQQGLAHLGVPPGIVANFFTRYNQAPILLNLKHPEIPEETRERFVQEAQQLSLTALREYLGVG